MAVRARWQGRVVAESDDTVVVEGNHYFPADDVRWELLAPSSQRSLCPWKGWARYYDVAGNPGAAWTYERPLPPARRLLGRVAFWHGVEVDEAAEPT